MSIPQSQPTSNSRHQRRSRWKWIQIALLSLISLVTLLTGATIALANTLGWFGKNATQTPAPPTPSPNTQPVGQVPGSKPSSDPLASTTWNVLAIGDSLTRGIGDPSGQGYVGYLQAEIEKQGKKIELSNRSVSGMVSSELRDQVQSPDLQQQFQQATIVLLSIGGNDLVRSVPSITAPQMEQTKPALEAYLKNLRSVLTVIRQQNQHAPILMVGLYNPFLQLQKGSTGTEIVEQWNAQTSALLREFSGASLVPTSDMFTVHGDSYLAADFFHPNALGYQSIATRMMQDLPLKNAVKKSP